LPSWKQAREIAFKNMDRKFGSIRVDVEAQLRYPLDFIMNHLWQSVKSVAKICLQVKPVLKSDFPGKQATGSPVTGNSFYLCASKI
jgi:hypothetical protein